MSGNYRFNSVSSRAVRRSRHRLSYQPPHRDKPKRRRGAGTN